MHDPASITPALTDDDDGSGDAASRIRLDPGRALRDAIREQWLMLIVCIALLAIAEFLMGRMVSELLTTKTGTAIAVSGLLLFAAGFVWAQVLIRRCGRSGSISPEAMTKLGDDLVRIRRRVVLATLLQLTGTFALLAGGPILYLLSS